MGSCRHKKRISKKTMEGDFVTDIDPQGLLREHSPELFDRRANRGFVWKPGKKLHGFRPSRLIRKKETGDGNGVDPMRRAPQKSKEAKKYRWTSERSKKLIGKGGGDFARGKRTSIREEVTARRGEKIITKN